MLLVADTLGIACAIGLAALTDHYAPWLLLSWPLLVVLGKVNGLYGGDEERAHHTTIDDVEGVFNTFTTGAFLLLVLSLLVGDAIDSKELVIFWAFSVSLVLCLRFVARGITRRTTAYQQNTIIVGAGDVGQLIGRKISQHPEYGINLVGFVDGNPKNSRSGNGDLTILGDVSSLDEIVKSNGIERVVVAFSGETNEDTLSLVRTLRNSNVQIDIVPRLFEAVGLSADLHAIEGSPLLGLPSLRIGRTSRWVKRLLDVVSARCCWCSSLHCFVSHRDCVSGARPGPILFRQSRSGDELAAVHMLKFRTMHADTDRQLHREYIEWQHGQVGLAPSDNGLYKLDRPTR